MILELYSMIRQTEEMYPIIRQTEILHAKREARRSMMKIMKVWFLRGLNERRGDISTFL